MPRGVPARRAHSSSSRGGRAGSTAEPPPRKRARAGSNVAAITAPETPPLPRRAAAMNAEQSIRRRAMSGRRGKSAASAAAAPSVERHKEKPADEKKDEAKEEKRRGRVVQKQQGRVVLDVPGEGAVLGRACAEALVGACRDSIGEGRVGVAFDVETTTGHVAVKLWRVQRRLQKGDLEYLRAEVVALQTCVSDNTVRLIGYYDHAPFACLVTELCERGTLATFASRNRALCRALARRFTLELENAVCTIHRCGYLHRDIKPENCFICPDGDSFKLKLGDFGHATPIAEAQASVRGTDAWAAPELDRGARATTKSDVYSVGLVVHFMATGATPTPGRAVACPRTWHASWTDLVRACLARAPEHRPTHDTLIALIARLTEHPTARPPSTTTTHRP